MTGRVERLVFGVVRSTPRKRRARKKPGRLNPGKGAYKMKIYYSGEEALDIIRKELYQEPDEEGNYYGLFDIETNEIAKVIMGMTFPQLKSLAKALRIISQGKQE